jgi:hypothetical protein
MQCVMEQTLDIPHRVADAMGALEGCSGKQHAIAIVVPLREGMREVASEFLAEGPPFDPKEIGLSRHGVFLTDSEVVFVFETEGNLTTLDRILAEPEFWSIVSAWDHLAAGEPRVGTVAFDWSLR